jgi:hypothetical protein
MTDNGELLDPCYDPDLNGERILESLIEACEIRACKMGIETLVINIPSDEERMNRACRENDMRQRELGRTFGISIKDYETFLAKLLERTPPPPGRYRVEILDSGGRSTHVLFTIRDGEVTVGDEGAVDVVVRISDGAICKLIFLGGLGPVDWLTGKISIRPIWRSARGLAFVRSLKLESSWFVPRGGTF